MTSSYNNIAIVYEELGKYEETLEMHMKSLEIRTRFYVDSHAAWRARTTT